MTDEKRSKALLRGLMYPVQFESEPVQAVDRVLKHVVDGKALSAEPNEFLAAIHWGLSSDQKLSALLPQELPEAKIRAYLAAFRDQLEARAMRDPQQRSELAVPIG